MAEVFNPDNVLLSEARNGVIPGQHSKLILEDVVGNSRVMQLGNIVNMTDASGRPVKEKKFQYLADGPGAYWVDEAEKIETSKATWLDAKMTAHKLGVIIPVSKEFLKFNLSRFFEEIKPEVQKAFHLKFDEAAILGVDNPFAQSIEGAIAETGQVVTGEVDADNFFALEDALAENDMDVNAYISTKANKSSFRKLAHPITGADVDYDRSDNRLDGVPVVDMPSRAVPKGTLYALDANHLHYGIPGTIEYDVSDQATISTLTDSEGNAVNLWERDLVALKATMYVAFMQTKDEAFAKIEPGDEGVAQASIPAGNEQAPAYSPEDEESTLKDMTNNELKAILDDLGVEYTTKATKDELIAQIEEELAKGE